MSESAGASTAVSLLDEARRYERHGGSACSVGQAEAVLGSELTDALASTVMASALARALKNRGYAISDQSISRHRRGDCQCRS